MAKMKRRRSRAITKHSRMGKMVGKVSLCVFAMFMAALANWRADAIVTQKRDEIKNAEIGLAKVAGDLKREQAIWNEMTSVTKFDRVLASRGISMARPTGRQIVYMDRAGRPKDGVAVAWARERMNRTASTRPRRRR